MRYPLDRVDAIRYGDGGRGKSWFGGSTNTDYDGERVEVSGRGTLLYADVEVQLPKQAVEGAFRNQVGDLSGRGLQGTLRFESGSGRIDLADIRGSVRASTGSGTVKAEGVKGDVTCETGSGGCTISDVHGEELACSTGSGAIALAHVQASTVTAQTGSGSIDAKDLDARDFDADTGSGDVRLEATGGRLARVSADTGSGDVTLKLGADARFEATADQGSGDIDNHFPDAEPIVRRKEVVGYRRGHDGIRIDVNTGSGDLTLEP